MAFSQFIVVPVVPTRSHWPSCTAIGTYRASSYTCTDVSTSKTKLAAAAEEQSKTVQELLGAVNDSLARVAADHCPTTGAATANNVSKRKAPSDNIETPSAKKKKSVGLNQSPNKNAELAAREERAIEQLVAFVEERGKSADSVLNGFRSRVTRKGTRFDVNFYNATGRRFRSMQEVGRFLKIVTDDGGKTKVKRQRGGSSKNHDTEKKRIRKELEKLRKAHQRATKSLDDHTTTNNESRFSLDDRILIEEHASSEGALSSINTSRPTCAEARIPDMTGFPGILPHCTPEVLMTWDFLCTFDRALSLAPIALDDFASALVYVPPDGQMGDDVLVPPVYLAEAHLALLKLLLHDKSSDDWWWSVLETEETEGINVAGVLEYAVGKEDLDRPVIRINIAAALAEVEDPLITASWLSSLETVIDVMASKGALKSAIRAALKLATNKWVSAYLRKTLEVFKVSGGTLTQQAVRWLVRRIREARPDLGERATNQNAVFDARAKVVEEANMLMDSLGSSAPAVGDEDAISDFEFDDDESDDESDDEDEDKRDIQNGHKDTLDESERPASALPPKPLPTLVDLLLPPAKPLSTAEFVDSFSWSHLVGAAAARVLHRKRRVLNEVDDHIREANLLPRLVVSDRREREKLAASRVLTECEDGLVSPLEKATQHLCAGGNYLDLSPLQRLCILRILIEASYDTGRVYEVVSGNYKQRTSAMKALEVEQRRAKREAKEKAATDEAAARERLAADSREAFLDEKREEIRQLNAKSKEFSDDVIESLTDEDIIDFDDDIKADYEALPTPESFNKTEVTQMIARLLEEVAFETDALRVLSMDELREKEKRELDELEGQFSGFGGEDALLDGSLDRETIRTLERLRRDVERARAQAQSLPALRLVALSQLKDAMDDGRIKVLRTAYTAAKKAKLIGTDDETGGVWAIDLMRDAALEFEKAKQNKRVLDAQKDLVAKRNKCFIRTEPTGRDRFGNRYWMYSKKNDDGDDESGRVWVETELTVESGEGSSMKPRLGFLSFATEPQSIAYGAPDMEEDWHTRNDSESFLLFSRREYHSTGFTATLAKQHWGCYAREDSLRALTKSLDSTSILENELKTKLKQVLEETLGSGDGDKHDARDLVSIVDEEPDEADGDRLRFDSDEAVFIEAKDAMISSEDLESEALDGLYSGIGASARVRQIVDASKDAPVARYENGTVDAWKLRLNKIKADKNGDAKEFGEIVVTDGEVKIVEVPLWRVLTERGHAFWLTGAELIEGLSRFNKWTHGQGYFENDSAFFSYRNTIGRFCGKASEAPYAASPYFFAKLMLKKESELYPKLKIRNYDNSWGGQSGERALWTNSMRDYAYDFQTVKQGLLTLEKAMFELTGEFSDYTDPQKPGDVAALLKDRKAVIEIELESMEKNLPGLWNSPTSRAVFQYIVTGSKTTGFLALALDLLCRNTMKYLLTHNLLAVRGGESASAALATSTGSRTTRRMNAWQQQQQQIQGAWF